MLKYTQYFLTTRLRLDRFFIQDAWIERVVANPLQEVRQSDGRVKCWGFVPEAEGRILRVVLLEDRVTVHNAFFDRGFKL
jgi:hypothetical protein